MSADIELIIKIPNRIYKTIQNRHLNIIDKEIIEDAIRNGIPLSKGHGRLIDENTITEVYTRKTGWKDVNGIKVYPRIEIIGTNAPTIIEKDGN